jgi:uncharacterized tellurite resistance protein B-like protein
MGGFTKMKKDREPGKMPQEIRLAYAKILSLMLTATPHPESAVVVYFYRAMQELNLKERDRRAVLEFMLSPDAEAGNLCSILMEAKGEEERNLLRFTLLEDLYGMLMADHYEGDEEAAFLVRMAKKLAIRQEHLDQVRLMHASESTYLPEMPVHSLSSRLLRQTLAGVAGVWVPLGLLAGSGERGLKPKELISGLRALSPGQKRHRSILPGLLITLATGAAAWQTARWLFYLPERRREWMLHRLRKAAVSQLLQAEKDMMKDAQILQRQIGKRAKDFLETDSWQELLELLRRSQATVSVMIRDLRIRRP